MSRYICHSCKAEHGEDNMVAYCASCGFARLRPANKAAEGGWKMSDINPPEKWREDGILRDPKQSEIDDLRSRLQAEREKSAWLEKEVVALGDEMTNKTKPQTHTPGPWQLNQVLSEESNAYRIRGSDNEEIALLFYGPSAANASLIAAAPELKNAAQAIIEAYEGKVGKGDFTEAYNLACAAITKAERQ